MTASAKKAHKAQRKSSAPRQRAEKDGRRAEGLARLILRAKGFNIIARRFKAPMGEIDLIARRGRLIAFIEVKRRKTVDEATSAVTWNSRRRIAGAAAYFLARRPDLAQCDMRYDIIAMSGWRFRHISGAWVEGD